MSQARERFAQWRGNALNGLYGRNPAPFRAELEESQWWNETKIETWQEVQLSKLSEHAYAHTEFYRDRLQSIGWQPGERITLDKWSKLPPLSKEDLRTNSEKLRTHTQSNLKCNSTSGTTGTPLSVWREASYLSYLEAVRRRAFRWFDVEVSSPTFYFGGAPHDLAGKLRRGIIDIAISRRCLPAYDMSADYLDLVIKKVREFRPVILCGYTSALYALAQHLETKNETLSDLGIRMVLTMSELTQPWHVDILERVTGAPVTTEYGCVEIGGMAYVCPHGTNHISHDHVIFEVLDDQGNPCEEGVTGNVVLTPLQAYEMPLLRYELGDRGTLRRGSCACGRQSGMHFLSEIAGRSFDQIIDTEGKKWNGILLYYTFKEVLDPGVFKEFQAIQPAPGKLELRIIPGQKFSAEIAEEFSDAIKKRMNGAVNVAWRNVSSIEREKSAKFKYFKSLI